VVVPGGRIVRIKAVPPDRVYGRSLIRLRLVADRLRQSPTAWFRVFVTYFAFIGRHRLILSPEEEFALQRRRAD
jgi:hypothetical protein